MICIYRKCDSDCNVHIKVERWLFSANTGIETNPENSRQLNRPKRSMIAVRVVLVNIPE